MTKTRPWLGRADCSGQIKLAWEPRAIYVYAEIRDDNPRESSAGEMPWQEDGIEVFLGLLGAAYGPREYMDLQGEDRGDFQFYPVTLVPGRDPHVAVRITPDGTTAFSANGAPIIDRAYTGFATGGWKNPITAHHSGNWSPRMRLQEDSRQITVTLDAGPPEILN